MATDTLKSASITNLDASPIVKNQAGQGAGAILQQIEDYVTPTAAGIASTSSTYKTVRVPTNCYLKSIKLTADGDLDTGGGSAALAVDVGAYYSDSTVDGTPVANQGTAVNAGKNDFGAVIPFGGGTSGFPNVVTVTDGLVAGPVAWNSVKRQTLLWSALGLTADPGGNFDIVVAVHTAANTGASHVLRVEVTYVTP